MNVDQLLPLWPGALARVLADSHPLDINALDEREYHGISLGQPRFVQWLTWLKFKKVFHRDKETGKLRGWNVRCVQTPLEQPWEDRFAGEERLTWGHYGVYEVEKGLMIDYGLAGGGFDPQRLIKDPLRAVNAGSNELLIGYSYLDLGVARLGLPTFFALIRGGPLEYVVNP